MQNITQAPIGVFDSGVGGLTVVKRIIQDLPGENIVYLGDTARYPYGTRSPEMVRRFALQNARFLMGFGVKALVVACNTASSLAMDMLRQWIRVPIIGVIEPGARIAAKTTKNRKIGVIGTIGTISSSAYQRAISAMNDNIRIFAKACPLFVPMAEEGWTNDGIARDVAHVYLDKIAQEGIDTLVLGCTHYPLLRDAIKEAIGDGIAIVDSAKATVAELNRFLSDNHLLGDTKNAERRFFVTDAPQRFEIVGEAFLGQKISAVECVQLEL